MCPRCSSRPLAITSQLAKHRRELCSIVASNSEDKELRKSILKHRSKTLSLEATEIPETERTEFQLKLREIFIMIGPESNQGQLLRS